MSVEEFGWFERILQEFVKKNIVSDKKKKWIQSNLRARYRGRKEFAAETQ